MGGREGKPKTGPGQYANNGGASALKTGNKANPDGCPKPSLQTCEQIYSDPNSPDYVGDGYAPPGANCVCHIDSKTGHAVITDLPNASRETLSKANAGSAAKVPTGGATPTPTAGAAPAAGGTPAPGAATPPPVASSLAAAAGAAAADTAKSVTDAAATVTKGATDAAEQAEKESKGMWHHAKGLASATAKGIGDMASGIWNGAKGVGKAIFGEEDATSEGQDDDLELYLASGEHPDRTSSEVSLSHSLDEFLEDDLDFDDDELALGVPGNFGVH